MFDGLAFGWRTAVLTVAAAVILPIAAGLWNAFHDRLAARTLAGLLVVLVGVFTPWLIGFAGFYDRWEWLTFLPVANPLWAPPLLFLYAHALTRARWPKRAWRHLVPGAVQFVWQTAGFVLPLPLKDRWEDLSAPVTGPLFTALLTVSFLAYGRATMRLMARHRASMAETRSDDARFAALWLRRAMGVSLGLALMWSVYGIWDAISPLGYRGLMGLYVGVSAVAVYLAVEGWRQTRVPYPKIEVVAAPPTAPPGRRDWTAQGRAWGERLAAEGWHLEPDLTLAGLAARLGTNTAYLSRAINEGLGVNFSTFINDLRCDAVADRLRAKTAVPVLTLALDAGFSSKASFNRAFRARFGQTPQEMRAEARRLKS